MRLGASIVTTLIETPPIKSSIVPTDSLQVYRGRTWEQFKLIQKGLEDSPGLRLFFFEGIVEVLMPGRYHELFKRSIAVLIDAFLFDREIESSLTGSMDREREGSASAQPDESYEIGPYKLAIEITVTSGTIAKLELYKVLGIDEVWFWQDGVLRLYHLVDGGYQGVDRSHIPELAGIDVAVLSKCILMGETSWVRAVKTFRSAHPVG
jgi:Uma2 family endonuclease